MRLHWIVWALRLHFILCKFVSIIFHFDHIILHSVQLSISAWLIEILTSHTSKPTTRVGGNENVFWVDRLLEYNANRADLDSLHLPSDCTTPLGPRSTGRHHRITRKRRDSVESDPNAEIEVVQAELN